LKNGHGFWVGMMSENMRKGILLIFSQFYKITFSLLCLTVFSGAAFPAQAAPLPLDQLLVKMQEAYDLAKDVKASFAQETVIKSMNKKQREEGIVYYKKPRQMYWDYTKPKVKKLIITATKAWFYIPQDNAVYVQDADKIFKSQLAVRFFSGIGNLRHDLDIAYAQERAVDDQGHYRLVLKPKSPDPGISNMKMTVDQESFQILDCSFLDTYGNDTRIQFRNIKINTAIPDRFFQFKPPPKADIFPMQ
jgi:outer membrane lipoprotein carrier protein